jgi:adenine-specific DNA-methyltransferase
MNPTITSKIDGLLTKIEAIRIEATQSLHPQTQKNEGQFFTPMPLARLVASNITINKKEKLRILDPGAGVASLSAALLCRIAEEGQSQKLEIVLLEKDSDLIPYLNRAKREISKFCKEIGVEVSIEVLNMDFFSLLALGGKHLETLDMPFDLIISNPPYGKINASSLDRKATRSMGVDCPNLYAGFVALSLRLLCKGGSLTAITPRSFMNGSYFMSFRKDLLNNLNLKRIHLFDSRSTLFSDTGVLQENVIFSGTFGKQQKKVEITSSENHIDDVRKEVFTYDQIVLPGDPEKFIRIPSADKTNDVIDILESLPYRLKDLGLEVSTGRVVDFRVSADISNPAKPGDSPLIYPSNFCNGQIEWPVVGKKPQSINTSLNSLLLPNEIYVLIKRFSSKEERRRIVAAIWEPSNADVEFVGFENHLNVIHVKNHGLSKDLALGLLYWLNSSIVDSYFRVFSGHTQVNAGDIRSMNFPSQEALQNLGKKVQSELPSQNEIDGYVQNVLSEISEASK